MNTDFNALASWTERVTTWLYGLPSLAVVALICLLTGYVVRYFRKTHDPLPFVVIVIGFALALFLAPDRPSGVSVVVWRAKNGLLGIISGLGAWMAHALILARLEEKFPGLGKLLGSDKPET